MAINIDKHIKYHVNEQKRTVVAVLEAEPLGVVYELIDIINKVNSANLMVKPMVDDKVLLASKYVGKAVCHPNDEFNVQIGMQYAKLRALRQYHRARKAIWTRIEDAFDAFEDKAEDAIEYTENMLKRMESDIETLHALSDKNTDTANKKSKKPGKKKKS